MATNLFEKVYNHFKAYYNNGYNLLKKLRDVYFGGPQDVNLQWQDPETGQVHNLVVPSFAKMRDRFISDVNSVMKKTVYVDAENGSDGTGDGSSSAPFKSIRKAIESTPPNAYVIIFLQKQQIYTIDGIIDLEKRTVKIITDHFHEPSCCVPSEKNAWFKPLNKNSGFFGHGAHIMLHFVNIDLLPEKDEGDNFWTGLMYRRYDHSSINISLFSPVIKLGKIPLIHKPSGPSLCRLSIFNATITKDDNSDLNVPLILLENGSTIEFYYSQHSAFEGFDIKNFISGIVKDSNGVPRNIISNIIL